MHHRVLASLALRPIVAALALALVAPVAALADDAPAAPTAGVARLSVVDGTVGIQRGDANGSVAAVINAPLLTADYVTTGAQSRAEVQFDGTTVMRLGENVQLRLSHVDPDDRQIQIAAGTIDVRLLRGVDGRTTIDTPSISVVPRSAGSYRIAVSDDGITFVTIRSGHADIVTPQGAQPLGAGTTLVAQGTASNPQIDTRDAIARDSFDAFNDDLDRAQLAALGDSPYVDPGIGGVSDLAANGTWVDDGSYGHVWIPSDVPAGWAPYRSGSWVVAAGFGPTWVAAEPWGWAPYHYGRWYFSAAYNRWAWYPPAPAGYAPAWSPALVGFVNVPFGGGGGLSIGFGRSVGWVPLAPHEAVRPWWGPRATPIVGVSIGAVAYRNARYAAAPGYAAARSYAQPTYRQSYAAPPSYSRAAYAEPSYRRAVYAEPGYSRSVYAEPGYGRGAYVAPGYGRANYGAYRGYAPRAASGGGYRTRPTRERG